MKQNNENTNAFLIHISAFAGFLFPFGSIITPLIAWQTLKNRSRFLDEQGKEAVNFNISYSLYMFLASLIIIPFFIRSIFDISRRAHYNYDWDWFCPSSDVSQDSGWNVLDIVNTVNCVLSQNCDCELNGNC